MFNKIKKFFKRSKGNNNAVITDEIRAKALETRRKNAQMRQLERELQSQKKLEMLEEAITGVKKGNPLEEMFMKLIMSQLVKPKIQQGQQTAYAYGNAQETHTEQRGETTLSDEQINQAVKVIKPRIPTEAMQFITRINDADLIKIKNKLLE